MKNILSNIYAEATHLMAVVPNMLLLIRLTAISHLTFQEISTQSYMECAQALEQSSHHLSFSINTFTQLTLSKLERY